MKTLAAICLGTLVIASSFRPVFADDTERESSRHETVEELPDVGEILTISFPNLGGDDILTLEFAVTEDMLDGAWSLNDVVVAAKLKARAGQLPVVRGNQPLKTKVAASEPEGPYESQGGCD